MESQKFFESLHPLLAGFKNISLVIAAKDGTLAVSVLPAARDVKDQAVEMIAPLTMCGTCEELDSGFIDALKAPLSKSRSFFASLEEYEASVDKAKEASNMESKKRTDEKKKKVEEQKADTKAKEKISTNDKEAETIIETVETNHPGKHHKQLQVIDEFLSKNPELSEDVKGRLNALRDKVKETLLPGLF